MGLFRVAVMHVLRCHNTGPADTDPTRPTDRSIHMATSVMVPCMGPSCPRPAAVTNPVALCALCALSVVSAVTKMYADREASDTVTGTLTLSQQRAIREACRVDVDSLPNGPHDSIVYFVLNGGRLKIGVSTNITDRMGSLSLRMTDVLAVLKGDRLLERALHIHFAAHRIGRTEWFDVAPSIFDYLGSLVPRVPTPDKLDVGTIGDKITRYIEHNGPSRAGQIAESVGATQGTVRTTVSRLVKVGAIMSDGNGLYWSATAGAVSTPTEVFRQLLTSNPTSTTVLDDVVARFPEHSRESLRGMLNKERRRLTLPTRYGP